jgi:hypothetical protein
LDVDAETGSTETGLEDVRWFELYQNSLPAANYWKLGDEPSGPVTENFLYKIREFHDGKNSGCNLLSHDAIQSDM